MDWIKEHPYLTGGLVIALVVLYFLFRGSSSSSSAPAITSSGPDDATAAAEIAGQVQSQQISAAASANTEQLNAGLQALVLQNQGASSQLSAAEQIYGQQTTAAQQVALAQAQAGVDTASISAGAQTQQSQIAATAGTTENAAQIAGAESVTGTQASVALAQLQDALQAEEGQNTTSVQLQQLQNQQVSATNQTSAQVDYTQLADALTALSDNNTTALSVNSSQLANNLQLAGINNDASETIAQLAAGVTNNQTQAQQTETDNTLATELAAILAEIQGQTQQQSSVIQYQTGLNSAVEQQASTLGPNNKAATLAALLNQPTIGTAEIGGQPGTGSSFASIISSFGTLLAGIGKGTGAAASGILG